MIQTFNTNLIFPETHAEMEMSGDTTPADTNAKIEDNLLSMQLISTFHTMTTKMSCATRKNIKQEKTSTTTINTNSYFVQQPL